MNRTGKQGLRKQRLQTQWLQSLRSSMPHRHSVELIALCLMILLAAVLRLRGLSRDSMWIDELLTVERAGSKGPAYLAREPAVLLAHLALRVGDLDYLLRFPFVIAGILGVVFIYRLGRLAFGPAEGLVAAFLLATSIYHIKWSQQARYYSLMVLFSVAATYFVYQALNANRAMHWIGFVLTATWNAQNHDSGYLVIASLGVWMAVLLIRQELRFARTKTRRPTAKAGSGRTGLATGRFRLAPLSSWSSERLIPLATSMVAIVSLLLPSILATLRTVSVPPDPSRTLINHETGTIRYEGSLGYYWGVISDLTAAYYVNPWLVVGPTALLFFLGIFDAFRRRQSRQAVLAISWMIVPVVVIETIILRTDVNFGASRHFMFWLPMLVLMSTRGAAALGRAIDHQVRGLSLNDARAPGLGLALVTMALFIPSLWQYADFYSRPQQEEWRAVAERIDREHQAGDVVVFNAWFNARLFDRYSPNSKAEVQRVPFPEGTRRVDAESMSELSELVRDQARVWLILSHHRADDRQRLISALSSNHHIIEQRDYREIEVLLFERGKPQRVESSGHGSLLPSAPDPDNVVDEIVLPEVRLVGYDLPSATVEVNRQLPMTLTWEVECPFESDIAVFVSALHERGADEPVALRKVLRKVGEYMEGKVHKFNYFTWLYSLDERGLERKVDDRFVTRATLTVPRNAVEGTYTVSVIAMPQQRFARNRSLAMQPWLEDEDRLDGVIVTTVRVVDLGTPASGSVD